MPEAYYLAEDGRATGPHSLAVLRQKAEIHVLFPESLVLPAGLPAVAPAAWTPIHALPELHDRLFPARARLSLGAAHVAQNISRDDATLAPTDVGALLRDNTARQLGAEGPLLPPAGAPYRYRRPRDYAWCAGLLNAGCLAYGLSFTFLNPFLLGLFVIGNLALLWVIFGVLDRY